MCVGPADRGEHVVEFGDMGGAGDPCLPDSVLQLDPATRVLRCRGGSVGLTPAQATLMILLMRAAPRPVSTGEIWKAVLGYVPTKRTSAVRVLVHKLRKACRETFGDDIVETVHGRGYRLRHSGPAIVLTSVSEK